MMHTTLLLLLLTLVNLLGIWWAVDTITEFIAQAICLLDANEAKRSKAILEATHSLADYKAASYIPKAYYNAEFN